MGAGLRYGLFTLADVIECSFVYSRCALQHATLIVFSCNEVFSGEEINKIQCVLVLEISHRPRRVAFDTSSLIHFFALTYMISVNFRERSASEILYHGNLRVVEHGWIR